MTRTGSLGRKSICLTFYCRGRTCLLIQTGRKPVVEQHLKKKKVRELPANDAKLHNLILANHAISEKAMIQYLWTRSAWDINDKPQISIFDAVISITYILPFPETKQNYGKELAQQAKASQKKQTKKNYEYLKPNGN